MLPRVPVTCRPLSPAQIYHEFQESALKKKFFFFNSAFYKSYLGDFSFLFKQFYYGKTTLRGIYPLSKRLRVQYVSDCSLVSSSVFQTHGTRPQCGRHPRPAALLVFSASLPVGYVWLPKRAQGPALCPGSPRRLVFSFIPAFLHAQA